MEDIRLFSIEMDLIGRTFQVFDILNLDEDINNIEVFDILSIP